MKELNHYFIDQNNNLRNIHGNVVAHWDFDKDKLRTTFCMIKTENDPLGYNINLTAEVDPDEVMNLIAKEDGNENQKPR